MDVHQIGSYRQRRQIFLNLRDGKFEEIGSSAGPGVRELFSSRGLALGDINNDGQLDVLIANLDEAPSLLQNKGVAGNWLMMKLKGTRANRSAIGARVTIKTGPLTQMREVKSGGSYQSQSDLRLHFGLGAARTVDEVKIRWPGGGTQTLKGVRGNQILTVEEKADH